MDERCNGLALKKSSGCTAPFEAQRASDCITDDDAATGARQITVSTRAAQTYVELNVSALVAYIPHTSGPHE